MDCAAENPSEWIIRHRHYYCRRTVFWLFWLAVDWHSNWKLNWFNSFAMALHFCLIKLAFVFTTHEMHTKLNDLNKWTREKTQQSTIDIYKSFGEMTRLFWSWVGHSTMNGQYIWLKTNSADSGNKLRINISVCVCVLSFLSRSNLSHYPRRTSTIVKYTNHLALLWRVECVFVLWPLIMDRIQLLDDGVPSVYSTILSDNAKSKKKRKKQCGIVRNISYLVWV